ncbi:hypothetical protein AO368_0469 [Moraxella catarrhalis]|nr:hypothetical protein AO374_1661 [Moraxella catarrhalis]OAV32397.1 hypothetical protein AO368_0469 [Moraxella catarrhalis]
MTTIHQPLLFCKIDGMSITQWWSFFSMYAFLKLSAHLRD